MVIIIGCEGYNTLGVIHCFAEVKEKFHLILISEYKTNTVLFSKFIKNNYDLVNTEYDAIKILLKNKIIWNNSTIIPTSDRVVMTLDQNQKDLSSHYNFPHTSIPGRLSFFLNKENQLQLAKKNGLNILPSFIYNKGDEIPNNITYPCIVKQIDSTDGYKCDIKKISNKSELKESLLNAQNTQHFIIQKYIEKESEYLIIGCRLNKNKTLLPAIFLKQRWKAKGSDGSFGLITTNINRYFKDLSHIYSFLEEIDYYGPFSIEFGVEKNIPYFFEINLRNDGTSHYFHKLGLRIPYIYYQYQNNQKINNPSISGEYCFIDEFEDFNNVILKNISFSLWIKDLLKAKSFKYISSNDLKPSLYLTLRFIKKYFKIIFKYAYDRMF